jgi:hypothetical protein
MAKDFDYDDDDFSPEEIAKIKRGMQEANMGYTYEMLKTDDGSFAFKCNKCGRSAEIHEKPFPHRFNCPMKNLGERD